MKTPIPEALKRVMVTEDAAQEAAAQIAVDYTGGANLATLTINPDLVPPEALEGYRVRAAIQAALEPLRKYNRAVTRRYGSYDHEQALFKSGIEQAAREIEQLVHLTPTGEAVPELAEVAKAAAVQDALLADDFPEVEGLRSIGLRTLQAVRDATDAELREAPGVGVKRLEAIRAALE
ncbi:hypothetical protein [Deinococcus sp. QL22]|uniref:hypothetical protein n=1 Tax=Deinococcus sp. QL22 TaxID=2939437 RepID=UPI0020173B3F|nr:hypothetical protein [Deinococcus sp. QL22]UQN10370.1 hypothetical protein M1R55_29910 [Deinococcus sp. QL22]UQN10504.1 hypothetical protein M1R55_29235 [Deinococcus sp. QL22]